MFVFRAAVLIRISPESRRCLQSSISASRATEATVEFANDDFLELALNDVFLDDARIEGDKLMPGIFSYCTCKFGGSIRR